MGCWREGSGCLVVCIFVLLCSRLLSSAKEEENVENSTRRIMKCNLYDGSWVYDDSYPMYDSRKCPHIRDEYNCIKYGRHDLHYLKYRWQPTQCDLPRFDGEEFLKIMYGKKIMFVGDSISVNQWQSLLCLLHASLPPQSKIFKKTANSTNTIIYQDYDVKIAIFRTHYLVDVEEEEIGRVLKLNSIKDGEIWKKYDVLIFNTWHWWHRRGAKQPWDYIEIHGEVVKDMNRMEAFHEGLKTWGNWVDSCLNTQKTLVFFQGISPSHYKGKQWNEPEVTNCGKETLPINGSRYPGGLPLASMTLEQVLSRMRKHVSLLNITTLSQLRKDAHPSIFNNFRGMDCTHWCVAGLPDTWNQLLFASLVSIDQQKGI